MEMYNRKILFKVGTHQVVKDSKKVIQDAITFTENAKKAGINLQ